MPAFLTKMIQQNAISFDQELPLQQIVDAIGDAQFVLLGESTHGTSEYYTARAQLSKKLIEEKGFTIIAVEGDWPATFEVNSHIKGYPSTEKSKRIVDVFNRWPTWMWANEEVSTFVDWLKVHNAQKEAIAQVGFYGFDLYSLPESIEELSQRLRDIIPNESDLIEAQQALSCFDPFEPLPDHYALSTYHFNQNCEAETESLQSIIQKYADFYPTEEEQRLNIKMNTLIIKNAEHYYRTSLQNDSQSWNIRDEHMAETVGELINYFGTDSKVIVWAHNTHIGDARATAMKNEGMLNIGQIFREKYGKENVYAVGFGTYEGTVIAGKAWGEPFQTMQVPPAKQHSWEHHLHSAGAYNQLLLFNKNNRQYFSEMIDHRAIGVVYQPEYEMYGNYVPSKISERYDGFIYYDKTTALHPIHV
nr:erythromycin esterase family protein [Sporosarcina ureilytica]